MTDSSFSPQCTTDEVADAKPKLDVEAASFVADGDGTPPSPEATTNAVELADLDRRVRAKLQMAKAGSTLRAYTSDWKHFVAWCDEMGLASLPAHPTTLARYLTFLSDGLGTKPATLQRRLVSIAQAHKLRGLEVPTKSPMPREVMAGIKRQRGTAQGGKKPILLNDLRAMVGSLGDSLIDCRDRALLLIGFAGAFRRSELVGLDVEDLVWSDQGLTVTLKRSKTDQEGVGLKKGIPFGRDQLTCPVSALKRWLEISEITAGPVFRAVDRHGNSKAERLSDKAVALVIKKRAQAIGLEPGSIGGHSLRSGLATQAAMNGASERVIMNQTGHRSVTSLRRYIRDGELFRENASGISGL